MEPLQNVERPAASEGLAARYPNASAPIILLTRIWPTPERPSVGIYVRNRAKGVPGLSVVRPRPRLSSPWVYAGLLLDALRIGRRIRGVEAHMLIPTGCVGLLVAWLRRVPLVVYVHGGDVRDWRSLPPPLRWAARLVARRAIRLVTNSEDTAGYLRELGGRPIVVPPGVDLDRFTPTDRPAERRVLYLGGRNPRKGPEVAEGLADTLVGPGMRDVEPADIPTLIAAHDILLMPSHAEPFGLAAVEAIASGRWVVARDVGGLRDIVVDGVNGSLVADDDFAGAIARVPDYDPHELASSVSQYGLRRWQEAMAATWDEVASIDG